MQNAHLIVLPAKYRTFLRHQWRHASQRMAEEQRSTITAYETLASDFASIKIPCASIYGKLKESFIEKSAQHMKTLLPHLDVSPLPDSQHHLFLRQ